MSRRKDLGIVGWREWVALPDLGIEAIKAKVDTGARSSSLHAFDLELIERGERTFAQFKVCPLQRTSFGTIEAEAEVIEHRDVKSSSGHAQPRPVILTTVAMLGAQWEIELTLARRDAMGFRLLLGRQAVRNRLLVDSGRSYFGGRPAKDVRRPSGARRAKKRGSGKGRG